MKKLVQVQEVEGEGLTALLGKNVRIFCLNYIYAGKLIGVNTSDIILENASIVFETGPLNTSGYSDAQSLGVKEWGIRTASIESYGEEI